MTYESADKSVKVGVRDIGEIIDLFDKISGRLNVFNITSKNVTLNVGLGTFDIDLGIEVRPGRPFNRVLKLPIFNTLSYKLTNLPSFQPLEEAIIQDKKDGIVISLDHIPRNAQTLLLNIKCPLKHRRFIDRLVYKQVQREPRKNYDSYWMSAQFRHLKTLQDNLDAVRVDDLDLLVKVHISQNIKDIIPHSFVQQMEVGKELLKTRDRNRKRILADDHLRLARSNSLVGKEDQVIKAIEDLVKPSKFEEYLDLEGQFYYHDCFQSGSFLRIPNFVIPSMMKVITKANLTLKEQGVKGEVQFQRKKFEDDFDDIFPDSIKKKKR
ncbi:MAG: hypothetical protein ACTSYH_00675 [Candidatus Heimdallarchaeaceae archaeon]